MANEKKKKKSKLKSKIRIGLIIICFIIFLISLSYVVKEVVINPYKNDKSVNVAKDLFYAEDEAAETQKDNNGKILKKFNKLIKKNSDVKGWIKIEGTNIDYPVVQSQKDDIENGYYYYLDYDWQGNASKLGSISLMKNIDITKDNVYVLFGHNIDYPPCMFHDILKYKDIDFYKQYPIINFDTLYEEQEWVVFSTMVIGSDEQQQEVMKSHFDNKKQFEKHLKMLKKNSVIETDVSANSDDKILVLYTCSYETNQSRTVVVARKLRKNEKKEAFISK